MNLDEKKALARLSQTQELNDRIDRDIERSHSLRVLMMGASCASTESQTKGIVRELAELEAQIIEDIDALVDLKTEITNQIKRLPDVKLQLVLELRYFCNRSWEQIANDLSMSPLHTRRLHRVALRAYCHAA